MGYTYASSILSSLFCTFLPPCVYYACVTCFIITDVINAIEVDDSNKSATSNFDVISFIHSNELPGDVAINSVCEVLNMLTDVKLIQFGSKGTYVHTCITNLYS